MILVTVVVIISFSIEFVSNNDKHNFNLNNDIEFTTNDNITDSNNNLFLYF